MKFSVLPTGKGAKLNRETEYFLKGGLHMKKLIMDVLFGVVVLVAIVLMEFLVTIPFGYYVEGGQESFQQVMNREFLLTALPATLVTFVFAMLLKTETLADAVRRGVIWTLIVGLYFFGVGIGNGNFMEMFGTLGIYVLLLCTFLGPIVYAKIKLRKTLPTP